MLSKLYKIFLPIFAATLFVYLPIIINPNLFLSRGNDLQEFFWPIFHFVKDQIINHETFPLWNNLFLSGTPLLPDPQAPLFYIPNLIFLIFPIGTGFILSFFLHSLIGGIGAYLAAHHGFKFSKSASVFTAILYVLTPRLSGYIEAGHFGLVATTAWLPFVLLAVIKLSKKANLNWSILLGLSLSTLFYTHVPTFIFAAIISSFLFLFLIFSNKVKKYGPVRYFTLGAIIAFGLTAISLLPQFEWASQTTRYTLLNDRNVYPKWTSILEFIKAIFIPWISGKEVLWQLDTEKWLALGIFPSLLAIYGFFKIKKPLVKFGLLVLSIIIALIALNNISPFYDLLLSQNWYVLARVSTRIWFVIALITVFLAGYGFEKLQNLKINKKLLFLFSFIIIGELIAFSWIRLSKPVPDQSRYASEEVYKFLQKDDAIFRVYCVNRCLSQRKAAEYNLELIEGYSTLVQKNYNSRAWQLTGAYWDYYSLAIPPIGTYKFENLQPDIEALGEQNTKYIISPYELENPNLVLEKEFEKYMIYRNTSVKPRAGAPITIYSPNHIRIDTSKYYSQSLILSEVYSPGWKAYLNGKEEVPVQETPISLRAINIKPSTDFVDFKYEPASYKWGRIITFSTLALLILSYKRIFYIFKKK